MLCKLLEVHDPRGPNRDPALSDEISEALQLTISPSWAKNNKLQRIMRMKITFQEVEVTRKAGGV